jgi:hypothetical protein
MKKPKPTRPRERAAVACCTHQFIHRILETRRTKTHVRRRFICDVHNKRWTTRTPIDSDHDARASGETRLRAGSDAWMLRWIKTLDAQNRKLELRSQRLDGAPPPLPTSCHHPEHAPQLHLFPKRRTSSASPRDRCHSRKK